MRPARGVSSFASLFALGVRLSRESRNRPTYTEERYSVLREALPRATSPGTLRHVAQSALAWGRPQRFPLSASADATVCAAPLDARRKTSSSQGRRRSVGKNRRAPTAGAKSLRSIQLRVPACSLRSQRHDDAGVVIASHDDRRLSVNNFDFHDRLGFAIDAVEPLKHEERV